MKWWKRIFGLEKKLLSPPSNRGGWWPIIKEPFTGAWQFNAEQRIEDTLCYWAVFRCVSIISSDIAKMRVKLLKADRNGIPSEVAVEPYSTLLGKPNSYQNRIQFFETWLNSKLMRGNTYILKQRKGAAIEALYPLDPCNVQPLVADNGMVFYQLKHDKLSTLGESVTVPASEIIHDRWNCFYHPLCGLSPIYAAGLNALTGLRIQKNAANFFGKASQPGGVLLAPGAISNETAQRLKEYWNEQFSGENVGRVAVLGDNMKFEKLALSAVEAQMIEQSKWTAETVAGTFGVPAYMLNTGSTPAYNNVQALVQVYYSQCLQILIESVEACLDTGLEMPTGVRTEFDLDELLRMDTATMVTAESEAIKAGFKAPNESRQRFGLKPVKGGDTPYLQQQNFSLSALDERDKAGPAPSSASTNQRNDRNGGEDDEARGFAQADQFKAKAAAARRRHARPLH